MRVLLAGALLAAAGTSGCAPDDGFLADDRFVCGGPSQCGDGWGCVRATPYADNFCAPGCDESCDGTCTGGEQPLCLRGCLIGEDGTPGSCQSADYSCIRTSIERNDGVCYPVQSCAVHEDCGPQELCLTQVLRELSRDPESLPLDNFYCVPTPDAEGRCPAGSEPADVSGPGSPEVCFQTCEVFDPRCPPGFACLTQLQQIAPYLDEVDGPSCALGTYGLSCQSDTNCFVGRCLDTATAQGEICTLTCDEASRLAGGCEELIGPHQSAWYLYRLECDEAAPSADGSGLCVVRYATNFPGCTEEPGSAYECASSLECTQVPFFAADVCTKRCTTADECNTELGADPAGWIYDCAGGFCLFESSEE